MGYSIRDLSKAVPVPARKFRQIVQYFAESDIPNAFFVAPVLGIPCTAPVPDGATPGRYGKSYWDGFAAVLAARGLLRVGDVKADMLHWVEDINWPGSAAVILFVRQNFCEFLPEIFSALREAHGKKDVGWFENLLGCFLHDLPLAQELLDYLQEDCWKDFDGDYGIERVLQRLKAELERAHK